MRWAGKWVGTCSRCVGEARSPLHPATTLNRLLRPTVLLLLPALSTSPPAEGLCAGGAGAADRGAGGEGAGQP